jgi:NTE family protein
VHPGQLIAVSASARKHAIILSGGGGYGAYEVGVLKALLTGKSPVTGFQPLVPEIVTGTSVGAYNATFMVSRLGAGAAQAAHDLERVWLERVCGGLGRCGNGVFRVRLDPGEYVQPTCYMPDPLRPFTTTVQDTAYLAAQLVARTISALQSHGSLLRRAIEEIDLSAAVDTAPYDDLIRETIDFDAVGRSPVALSVFATAWKTGAPKRFDNASGTLTAQAVQASASIPGLFPPTVVDGEAYVDGGLSINTPLAPAIAAGAEVIHVIFLDPKMSDIAIRVPLSTVTELYRMVAIMFANETRAQIVAIDRVNRALHALEHLSPKAGAETLSALLQTLPLLREHVARTKTYRPLEVHVYRPSPDVVEGLSGFLNFRRSYTQKLIDAGYSDAVGRSPHPATSATIPLAPSFLRHGATAGEQPG